MGGFLLFSFFFFGLVKVRNFRNNNNMSRMRDCFHGLIRLIKFVLLHDLELQIKVCVFIYFFHVSTKVCLRILNSN